MHARRSRGRFRPRTEGGTLSDAQALLELQHLDSQADRLGERRIGLPERAALTDCEARSVATEGGMAAQDAQRAELETPQRALEQEVAAVAEKAKRVEGELYSGSVTISKELAALQEELESLRRRQADLEDQVLTIMEQVEQVADARTALEREREALGVRAQELLGAIAEAEAAIDAELGELAAARDPVVARVPEPLLRSYERLRGNARLGGLAATSFDGKQCGACRITLPIDVVTRMRDAAPDTPVSCAQCGRLLVR